MDNIESDIQAYSYLQNTMLQTSCHWYGYKYDNLFVYVYNFSIAFLLVTGQSFIEMLSIKATFLRSALDFKPRYSGV